MNKIISVTIIIVVFLMSGYVGGSSFSWLFVVMGQKIAAIVSFIIGFMAGILTMLLLSHVIIVDKSDYAATLSSRISVICKPSKN